ncbi:SEC-C metal-binding domain-containing protein, partial [Allorhizocola rhizosphaerae]
GANRAAAAQQPVGTVPAPASRNSPCPCGSGKKYKRCHGATE